jgi:hypothetical protein
MQIDGAAPRHPSSSPWAESVAVAEKGGSRTLRGPDGPQTGFEDQRRHRAPSFSNVTGAFLDTALLPSRGNLRKHFQPQSPLTQLIRDAGRLLATVVTSTVPHEPNEIRRLVRKLEREASEPRRRVLRSRAVRCGSAWQRQIRTTRVERDVVSRTGSGGIIIEQSDRSTEIEVPHRVLRAGITAGESGTTSRR